MEEADSITIIARKFNIPLLTMDRSSRQNIHNETQGLSYTLKQRRLSDTEHTQKGSKTHSCYKCIEIILQIEHVLGHKTSLKKYKIETISNIFSRHKCVKLEIKYKKDTGKFANMRRLKNMLLNIMRHGRNQIQNLKKFGTSLVVQQLRICLAMQGT